jgi:transposase
MEEYIGLDVSMKETAVSIRRAGERIWRGKCASDPSIIAELIRKRAPAVKRVVFETGPLSIWFYHSLRAEGLPAICIDARHAKAALDMAANKTDANDADGLAQLAEVGFFREVRVKGFDSMLIRTLVAARTRLVRITTELSNQIRGVMKTFGLVVPAGKGSTFDCRSGRTCIDRASDAGSLAWHSHPRRRTRTPVGPGGAPESGLPHPYVHSRHRCDHLNRL